MKSWDGLETLLAGYLNEDFADFYGTPWGAVDTFARNQPDYAPQLRQEITDVLTTCQSDVVLARTLAHLGLNYLPGADGWESYRSWLLAVADRVDDILRSSPAA